MAEMLSLRLEFCQSSVTGTVLKDKRDGILCNNREIIIDVGQQRIRVSSLGELAMSDYRTIKELVIDTCMSEGHFPSYEKLTSLVLQHFPTSKWQKTHYAWYKSKIKTGEIVVPGISSGEREVAAGDQIDAEVEESIEASLSLERDLHSYLATRVSEIEVGLTLVENGVEYQTDAGRVDLLARDRENHTVVIELKAGKAKDSALGQLLGYMGCLSATGTTVRGILVASNFDSRVVFAARGLPNVKLVRYQLSFNLEEVL